MIEGRATFPDALEAEAFVRASEASYNDTVRRVGKMISDTPGLRFVTLAGPTCSGKTTTAERLSDILASVGKDLHIVSIDDFFFDRDTIVSRTKAGENPDFDSVDAVDLGAFEKAVRSIRRGGSVTLPRFDFTSGKRVEGATLRADIDDIFLFEGIQALYPEITGILGHDDSLSLYIEVGNSVKIGNLMFLQPEIRLLRRLVRDSRFRGSSAESVFLMWEEVRKNEIRNIIPHVGNADIRLDSTMAYGINMLKKDLLPLLGSLTEHPRFGDTASQLLSTLTEIESLPTSLLPKDSVYREFVGQEADNG